MGFRVSGYCPNSDRSNNWKMADETESEMETGIGFKRAYVGAVYYRA